LLGWMLDSWFSEEVCDLISDGNVFAVYVFAVMITKQI
jgi:hypothetical protein